MIRCCLIAFISSLSRNFSPGRVDLADVLTDLRTFAAQRRARYAIFEPYRSPSLSVSGGREPAIAIPSNSFPRITDQLCFVLTPSCLSTPSKRRRHNNCPKGHQQKYRNALLAWPKYRRMPKPLCRGSEIGTNFCKRTFRIAGRGKQWKNRAFGFRR